MKQLATLLFFLSLQFQTFAQADFAPVGAVWHHDMQYGVFRSSVLSDTIINSISAHKISIKALTANPWHAQGLIVKDHSDLLVYATPDTVFVYNQQVQGFTPLYIFNVQPGDTVCLPAYDFNASANYCIIIDSVKMVLYDTSMLKTVFTHSLSKPGFADYTFSGFSSSTNVGAYAEKIGSLETGFLPRCFSCPIPLDESIQPLTSLRCYADANRFIKWSADDCDKGIPQSAVRDLEQSISVTISPNPATENFTVSATEPIAAFALLSLDGKLLMNQNWKVGAQTMMVQTSGIAKGVYLLQIKGQNGSKTFSRIMIQ